MKRVIHPPKMEPTRTLMGYAGYDYHCVSGEKACYHRRIWEARFPRFHAYVTRQENTLIIELHIDQRNPGGRSNHDKAWAYKGGRIEQEMEHIVDTIQHGKRVGSVNKPNNANPVVKTAPKKRSLFDVLFK